MPIYEYKCKECGKEFEERQKFSDAPLTECIDCSGPVEKLISRSSFHLKGTGWYQTDFAGKGKDAKKKPESDKPVKPECAGCPSAEG